MNTGVVYAQYVSGSGSSTLDFRYVVAAGNLDTNGIVVNSAIVANGATVRDSIGNNASLTLTNVGSTSHVLVDGTDPTVASVDTVGNATTNAASVSYTVTFSEAVSGVTASDFTLTSSGSATGSIESVTAVSGSSNTYTVTVDNVSGAGSLRLDVNASSSIVDAAGTAVPGYTGGQSYTIDRIVPTVTEVSVPANGTYIDGQTLDFTVTYSTAVTLNTSGGEPTLTIELANGKTEQAQLLGASGNQLTFQYTVVSGDQDLTGIAIGSSVNLNGATLQDAFGNAADTTLHGVASTALVDVDAVAPTVTAVQVPAVGLYTPGEQLNLVVSYTEAVTVNTAGGTPGIAITLDSGTVIAHYVSGSGSNELTFSYTVASGNLDKAGIVVANAISTNGGSISSTDGNVAALALNNIGSTANVDVGPRSRRNRARLAARLRQSTSNAAGRPVRLGIARRWRKQSAAIAGNIAKHHARHLVAGAAAIGRPTRRGPHRPRRQPWRRNSHRQLRLHHRASVRHRTDCQPATRRMGGHDPQQPGSFQHPDLASTVDDRVARATCRRYIRRPERTANAAIVARCDTCRRTDDRRAPGRARRTARAGASRRPAPRSQSAGAKRRQGLTEPAILALRKSRLGTRKIGAGRPCAEDRAAARRLNF